MWEAEIISKEYKNGEVFVTVNFSDGENKLQKKFSAGAKDILDRVIESELNRLEQQKKMFNDVKVGAFERLPTEVLEVPTIPE